MYFGVFRCFKCISVYFGVYTDRGKPLGSAAVRRDWSLCADPPSSGCVISFEGACFSCDTYMRPFWWRRSQIILSPRVRILGISQLELLKFVAESWEFIDHQSRRSYPTKVNVIPYKTIIIFFLIQLSLFPESFMLFERLPCAFFRSARHQCQHSGSGKCPRPGQI